MRLPLGLAIPFCEYSGGNGYVSPQLVRRVSAQKKAVKEGGFSLRELKILQRFIQRIWLRGHGRKRSLQISGRASRVRPGQC